jgi:hypothetical protein
LYRYAHSIQAINVSGGCDVTNGGWLGGDARPAVGAGIAPVCALGRAGVVRVRLAFNGTVLEDMGLYGVSNGLTDESSGVPPPLAPYGTAPLPPILSKVPNANATLLQLFARAPLVKVPYHELGARSFRPLLP